MPKLSDAARITTKDNTIWRTCTGCGLPKSLPPEVDRCTVCITSDEQPFPDDQEQARRYAALVYRIEAWASMPHATDAERLDGIRQVLITADLHKAVP
ncbi:hypothetical protein [Actinoplanes sp. HUAS TT8]|uniref:hypothetical protein n=1 Tax=Actinoplanes sp. HUAS TT8 TaxID=3447453 RepID=UPI003F51FB3B